jgi:hypothetical protein
MFVTCGDGALVASDSGRRHQKIYMESTEVNGTELHGKSGW